jgi:hypothetical protein
LPGCSQKDVYRHIQQARASIVESDWEQITAIGYAIRRRGGTPQDGREGAARQRRFIIGCTACGHECAGDGAAIHRCRCVACRQDADAE